MFKISSYCKYTRLNMFAPLVNKCVIHTTDVCKKFLVAVKIYQKLATLVIFPYQTGWQYSNGTPLTGVQNARGMKKSRFSTNISLYLANDARQSQLLWKANRKPHPSFRMVPV